MTSLRPSLIPSDDGDSAMSNPLTNGVDRKAIAYLLRYETMVRQQEAEHMASIAHLRPLFDNLSKKEAPRMEDDDIDLEQEICFNQLLKMLEELNDPDTESYMQTDRQLVMVLETLTKKASGSGSITWAEFVQCYKTVVSGMQTLQNVTAPHLRARCKDRTLSMISLFEPPATKLLDESVIISSESKGRMNSDKRVVFALIGALIGAAAGEVFTRYMQEQPTVIVPPPPMKGALVSEKSPIFSPRTTPSKPPNNFEARAASCEARTSKPHALEARKTLEPPTKQVKKPDVAKLPEQQTSLNMQATGLSAAIGGATGMIMAPIVWTALQQVPAALAGLSVGSWGVVTLVGAVFLQGMFHSIGSVVKAFRKKRK